MTIYILLNEDAYRSMIASLDHDGDKDGEAAADACIEAIHDYAEANDIEVVEDNIPFPGLQVTSDDDENEWQERREVESDLSDITSRAIENI